MSGPFQAPTQTPISPPGGPHTAPAGSSRPGRAMIIAGIILIVGSILGGTVGTGMLGAGLGFSQFERDVAFDGPSDRLVPGTLSFSVLEPLDDSTPAMTVGVAVPAEVTEELDCSLVDPDGGDVSLQRAAYDEQLLDMTGRYSGYDVILIVRLDPGDYELTCSTGTESSASSGSSFTVGRVIGVEDVTSMLGPLAWMFVLWAIAGIAFLAGVVLLIVGLVRRSKANRPMAPMGPYGPGPFDQTPQSQPPYGQGGYGQPTYGQGGYGPPPYEPSRHEPQGDDQPTVPSPPAPDAQPPTSPEGSVGGWTIPPSKQQ